MIDYSTITDGASLGGNDLWQRLSGQSIIESNSGTIDLGEMFGGTGGTAGASTGNTFKGSFLIDDNAGLVSSGDLITWASWQVQNNTSSIRFLDVVDYGSFQIDGNKGDVSFDDVRVLGIFTIENNYSSISFGSMVDNGKFEIDNDHGRIYFAAGTALSQVEILQNFGTIYVGTTVWV